LAEALRKVAGFIRATKICADNSDGPKKARIPMDKNPNHGDRNHGSRDRRPQLEAVNPRFTTDPRFVLMEIRRHPVLRRPPPMTAPPKPEFHEQNRHTAAECWELKKALHELADMG